MVKSSAFSKAGFTAGFNSRVGEIDKTTEALLKDASYDLRDELYDMGQTKADTWNDRAQAFDDQNSYSASLSGLKKQYEELGDFVAQSTAGDDVTRRDEKYVNDAMRRTLGQHANHLFTETSEFKLGTEANRKTYMSEADMGSFGPSKNQGISSYIPSWIPGLGASSRDQSTTTDINDFENKAAELKTMFPRDRGLQLAPQSHFLPSNDRRIIPYSAPPATSTAPSMSPDDVTSLVSQLLESLSAAELDKASDMLAGRAILKRQSNAPSSSAITRPWQASQIQQWASPPSQASGFSRPSCGSCGSQAQNVSYHFHGTSFAPPMYQPSMFSGTSFAPMFPQDPFSSVFSSRRSIY